MIRNFQKMFRGKELKDLLWKATKASYVSAFQKVMKQIAEKSKEAYDWINKKNPQEWSRSHFSSNLECDMLLNNLSESFNAMILDAREMGIVSMLEAIRTKLMRRVHQRRDSMKNVHGTLCPKIQKQLDKAKETCFMFTLEWSGDSKFQFLGMGVNL
ncbi:unnamed protein product [Cuscuta epithymum]|nr:unnamed protein product [Cuscuta epithymum]